MKRIKADSIIFLTGSLGYGLIEILWRGRTHWSMTLAGGICFIAFKEIASRMSQFPALYRSVAASAAVTGVELIFGLVFNVLLKENVWDYSRMPFNFMGQICLLYSVLWGLLAIPFVPFAGNLYTRLLRQ